VIAVIMATEGIVNSEKSIIYARHAAGKQRKVNWPSLV
jgi:hypothetical protein